MPAQTSPQGLPQEALVTSQLLEVTQPSNVGLGQAKMPRKSWPVTFSAIQRHGGT